MRWSIAARRSSIQPCNEKSPSLVPQPRNVKVIATQPSSLAIRSINSGNVPALWRGIERADREPVTQDQSGQWPVPPGRTRQVPSEDEVAGLELAVHRVLITLSVSGPWLALAAEEPRTGQLVTTVARLDQRVGPEAQTGLGADDVVDHARLVPRVEVVDQLRALVSEEPGVLEPRGSLHDARR